MSTQYNWYKCSINGATDVEKIDSSDDQRAIDIFNKYYENLREAYETDKESVEATLFGFSLDKKTFIEISIDKRDEYRIKFECPIPKSFSFLKWNSLYQKEYYINSKDAAEDIIKEFFSLDPNKFQEYFDELPFKVVPHRAYY